MTGQNDSRFAADSGAEIDRGKYCLAPRLSGKAPGALIRRIWQLEAENADRFTRIENGEYGHNQTHIKGDGR